ncbi:MAG: alpha/beta fold hydrolase [Coriobacteriia bacterium]|nr:alpha/beta fold hydrolase [Coriobacteriia bacterium]
MAKIIKRVALALLALVLLMALGCVAFLSIGAMGPQEKARAALQSTATVEVTHPDSRTTLYTNVTDARNGYGLVFYQGAKVEADAYAPLLHQLADQGWTCVTADAPLNFSATDANAAGRLIPQVGGVDHWYVGGHSFGGFISAQYAAGHTDQVEGLVLLGSFALTDISASGLDVVTIHGTNDLVCSQEKFDNDRPNLPASARALNLQGGNHAQFGDYGPQDGDGTATITPEEQVTQTVDFVQKSVRD